jgi:hypothetical protein
MHMNKKAHEYLIAELNIYQKAYKIQFTHFMNVFYFWTAVVTAPVTVLTSSGNTNQSYFPLLLILIAILGFFLSLKMFDIRCSQLRYTSDMNFLRHFLYKEVKGNLPENYEHLYPPDTNLRKTARKDFGKWMAIIMSLLDSTYFCFGLILLQAGFSLASAYHIIIIILFVIFSIIFCYFGIWIYFHFVNQKVPEPKTLQKNN